MTSFLSTELFKKIINKGIFMRCYPKQTPFNFEKRPHETFFLPIKYALPKYELFASIDDDHNEPGYSLQSRGLYPKRFTKKRGPETQKTEKQPSFYRKYIVAHIPKSIRKIKNKIWSKIWRLKVYIELVMQGL